MSRSFPIPASKILVSVVCFSLALTALGLSMIPVSDAKGPGNPHDGQQIFRFDTFGDERLWTDILRMHEVIETSVSPATALSVGLKVDAAALPPNFLARHDLNSPATTVELLRRNAVVGVVAKVEDRRIVSLGITCALCHSTVDDSVAAGVGQRLDGWPNLQLNPGAIIALSPALTPAEAAVYNSWGPGRYDARFNIDGINAPTVIPPAYGLQNVEFETFTGDGPISYWNNYVAVTQMGGHGSFCDPRIDVCITLTPDLVVPKLPALLAYQLSLPAPPPPPGSFDPAAAARGEAVFNGAAGCASCHVPPTYTDVGNGPSAGTPLLHDAAETGMEPVHAARSATGKYRTTPLRALWQHAPYFHDGSAADLPAVVTHYDTHFGLGLTAAQKADLAEFLKSL
jgi:mono/diheme cytochrome c family protein